MKVIIFTLMMLISMLARVAYAEVPSNTVVIRYTGNIVSHPCEISLGNTTNLNLGDVDINALTTQGAETGPVYYTIHFSNCDIDTVITLTTVGATQPGFYGVYDSNLQPRKPDDLAMKVSAFIDGVEYDMSKYDKYIGDGSPLEIKPITRASIDYTKYDLGLRFKIVSKTDGPKLVGGVVGYMMFNIDYK